MEAIINTFVKNDMSIYNGHTFPIVGHCNGHFEVEINGMIIDFSVKEILIVNIELQMRHAIYRSEALGFDYWFDILKKYMKANGIKHNAEAPKEKREKTERIIPPEFETVNENDLFNFTNKNENDTES